MNGGGEPPSLIVVGGWGVNASMLGEAVVQWPGPVQFVSLDDRVLGAYRTVSEIAHALIRQYPDPAVWLGWSQGAQVVMAAADAPATPVERVITLAGFPRFVAGDGWPAGMVPETFEAFRKGFVADPDRTWRRFQQLLIHGCPRDETGEVRRELRQWIAEGPVATGARLERGLLWLAEEDQRSLWRRLTRPALHLLAGSDALVHPWAADLPVSESATVRVIPGMTHWPVGSKAGDCGQALTDFALSGEIA